MELSILLAQLSGVMSSSPSQRPAVVSPLKKTQQKQNHLNDSRGVVEVGLGFYDPSVHFKVVLITLFISAAPQAKSEALL